MEALYFGFGLAAVPEAILEFGRLRFLSGLLAVTGTAFLVNYSASGATVRLAA